MVVWLKSMFGGVALRGWDAGGLGRVVPHPDQRKQRFGVVRLCGIAWSDAVRQWLECQAICNTTTQGCDTWIPAALFAM